MLFTEYYGPPYRVDLHAVVEALPSLHDHADFNAVTIQPRTLSRKNVVIRSWNSERIDLFASALFFTVLVDQVAFTHFHSHYHQFQDLTRYPKFRGDCPGGCNYHVHPSTVFRAIASQLAPLSGEAKLLPEAVEVMHAEVLSFFSEHMLSVDGQEFWEKCVPEFPRPSIFR